MPNWNFGEAVYRLADSYPNRPALIHGQQIVTYAELAQRGGAIAQYLQSLGLAAGAHIGHYLRNSPAYMEAFTGSALAGCCHVNINYRYLDDELADLCNKLHIKVLVYDAEFGPRVAAIRQRLNSVVGFIQVGGASHDANTQTLASLYANRNPGYCRRTSPDDIIIIATGGTTGLPKGTCWRHQDMWHRLGVSTGQGLMSLGLTEHPASLAEHLDNIAKLPQAAPFMCLSPLMHGAGLMMAMAMLGQGTAVVTLPGSRFDPDQTLDAIVQHGVGSLVLVGDAFALPLVQALDQRSAQQPLRSLRGLISSGASLSDHTRQGLLRHQSELRIIDTLGSTESSGYALATDEAGVFAPNPGTQILDDNLQPVVPGSNTIGMIYAAGPQPIGYYNAPEASAGTFITHNGTRLVRTGDRCQLRADGMLVLLGRDSTVINTGGEKVYTVEVERALTSFPGVSDALVVGLPHPRFGKMVAAVVEGSGLTTNTLPTEALLQHVAAQLADYKVPRRIYAIESLQRAANGKADYAFINRYAESCWQAEQNN